ncbi:MAG TPA: hypothetical protein VN906_11245 [Candidatus Sulfotelmatobacter sp.]|nr:hypothetical protein [Candidatus Sulfotelmatobacter sp.]
MKRKLLLLTVPAVLLLGAATVVAATPSPNQPKPAASEPAETPGAVEPAETADPAEPAGAAGTTTGTQAGHADNPSDPNADHQFDGQE